MSDYKVTVSYIAHIEHVPSGRKVQYGDAFTEDTWGGCLHDMMYMWREGNYSCDCNRGLFFDRCVPAAEALEWDARDPHTCTETEFKVTHLETDDGVIILVDSER